MVPPHFPSLSSEGSCRLLTFLLCAPFIAPRPPKTFFLRQVHRIPWLPLKAPSGGLVSKTSSDPHFVQVIIKLLFLWMHRLWLGREPGCISAPTWLYSLTQLPCRSEPPLPGRVRHSSVSNCIPSPHSNQLFIFTSSLTSCPAKWWPLQNLKYVFLAFFFFPSSFSWSPSYSEFNYLSSPLPVQPIFHTAGHLEGIYMGNLPQFFLSSR